MSDEQQNPIDPAAAPDPAAAQPAAQPAAEAAPAEPVAGPAEPVATEAAPDVTNGATEAATPAMPDLGDLAGQAVGGEGATMELLYDLSLPLTVELGRAALRVQDVLALGQGSVVRLDRVAGDPVDVYVGTKRLAQAEVVVLEEQFGIRITHIYPEAGV